MHQLSVHSVEAWFAIKSFEGGVSSSPQAGGQPGGIQTKASCLPFTLTPSIGTEVEEDMDDRESKLVESNRIMSFLKSFAVKVLKINCVRIVCTNQFFFRV